MTPKETLKIEILESLPSELAKHLAEMNEEFGGKKKLYSSDHVAIGKIAYFVKIETDKLLAKQDNV